MKSARASGDKYVQRVLNGAHPRDLRVETIENIELAINLQTAKQLGLTIPSQVLARAKKVFDNFGLRIADFEF